MNKWKQILQKRELKIAVLDLIYTFPPTGKFQKLKKKKRIKQQYEISFCEIFFLSSLAVF